jgi:hypothetical protein
MLCTYFLLRRMRAERRDVGVHQQSEQQVQCYRALSAWAFERRTARTLDKVLDQRPSFAQAWTITANCRMSFEQPCFCVPFEETTVAKVRQKGVDVQIRVGCGFFRRILGRRS